VPKWILKILENIFSRKIVFYLRYEFTAYSVFDGKKFCSEKTSEKISVCVYSLRIHDAFMPFAKDIFEKTGLLCIPFISCRD